HALEALTLGPGPQPKQPVQPAATQAAAPTPTVDIAPAGQDTGTAAAGQQTVDLGPASTPPPLPPPPGGGGRGGGATVLLVEPSRSQAVIIRGYLQKLGFQDIPTTPSGQKALEIARAASPKVVISAMHLADMTGVQLAQKMRAEGPLSSTGFILITS